MAKEIEKKERKVFEYRVIIPGVGECLIKAPQTDTALDMARLKLGATKPMMRKARAVRI